MSYFLDILSHLVFSLESFLYFQYKYFETSSFCGYEALKKIREKISNLVMFIFSFKIGYKENFKEESPMNSHFRHCPACSFCSIFTPSF